MAPAPALVLFDLGQVLSSAPARLAVLSRIAEVAPDALEPAFWRHRDAYDRGGSDDEYWTSVLDDAGGPLPSAGTIARLATADAEIATRIRPRAAAILRALASKGTEIGVLSNAPRAMARRARERAWGAAVAHWFFSAEIGAAKPDPRLYAHVADTLAITPGGILFVDDRAENVAAARAAGWDAHLCTSDAATARLVGVEHDELEPARVAVFDLGEVLASDPTLFERLAETIGTHSPSAVEEAYWRHREPHDRGISASAFWGSVLAELGQRRDDALIAALTALDADAWTDARPAAVATLHAASEAGIPVCVLSNAPRELAAVARTRAWAPLVDEWFFSGELETVKPEPEIYRHVQDALQVSPGRLTFFDDRPENVEAACRAGWDGRLWESDDVTSAAVASLIAATPPS